MLILITTRCSMGCSHCMSDCKPEGRDMSIATFRDALDFSINRYYPTPILISGGEPSENPEFHEIIDHALSVLEKKHDGLLSLSILSNGTRLTENFLSRMDRTHISIQVVLDDRYYPQRPDVEMLSRHSSVLLCQDVQHLYPQGRALANHLPATANASKCFNTRAVVKQIKPKSLHELALRYNIGMQKFCSPNIGPEGEIRLGESFLCPPCSSIYKTDTEIINDIWNFKCHQCDFINDKLPEKYRQFL